MEETKKQRVVVTIDRRKFDFAIDLAHQSQLEKTLPTFIWITGEHGHP